jgi:hypothetical protein
MYHVLSGLVSEPLMSTTPSLQTWWFTWMCVRWVGWSWPDSESNTLRSVSLAYLIDHVSRHVWSGLVQGCRTGPHLWHRWDPLCVQFTVPFRPSFTPFLDTTSPFQNYFFLSIVSCVHTPTFNLISVWNSMRMVGSMGHWDEGWRAFVRRRARGPSLCLWLRVWIRKWLWLYFGVSDGRDTEGIRFF